MNTNNRRYLKTISNAQQIHDHPCNKSVSKNLFSFSKKKRFSFKIEDWKIKMPFYNANESKYQSYRASSLGKGDKLDFTKKNDNIPGPNSYKPELETINYRVKKHPGIKMGLSRDKCPIIGTIPIAQKSVIPGPGTYDIKRDLGNKKGISFRIKLKDSKKENSENGPGKYKILSIFGLKQSALILSNFKSKGFAKINPIPTNKARLPLFQKDQIIYDVNDSLNKNGVYFNSKYKNNQSNVFKKNRRKSINSNRENPGPGSYLLQSDFGVYMSSTFNQKS